MTGCTQRPPGANGIDERLGDLAERLRARGGRVTPQRLAILKALLMLDHPTVDQVYEQVRDQYPSISVVTVYRTLSLLKEMGDVFEVRTGDLSSHYDGHRSRPHPHLVCRECGRTIDAPASDLQSLIDTLEGHADGWRLSHEMHIYGVCPECWRE